MLKERACSLTLRKELSPMPGPTQLVDLEACKESWVCMKTCGLSVQFSTILKSCSMSSCSCLLSTVSHYINLSQLLCAPVPPWPLVAPLICTSFLHLLDNVIHVVLSFCPLQYKSVYPNICKGRLVLQNSKCLHWKEREYPFILFLNCNKFLLPTLLLVIRPESTTLIFLVCHPLSISSLALQRYVTKWQT